MTRATSIIPSRPTRAAALLGLVCALGLFGCRGERTDEPPRQFIPDMDDSPKFKPQSEAAFFPDGRSMRQRVPGTVAFGERPDAADFRRAAWLREPTEIYTGVDPSKPLDKDGKPQHVRTIPPQVLDDFIEAQRDRGVTFPSREAAFRAQIARGQQRFNIYCSVCHGYGGEGGNPAAGVGGQVGRRWSYPVPTYHDAKYTDRDQPTGSDGYIFSVIRNGVPEVDPAKPNKMPSYADKVNEADGWAIVAYIRVLQASWQEDLKAIPPDQREQLERTRPALPPPVPEAGKQTSMAPTPTEARP